jgi:hypothetical protein
VSSDAIAKGRREIIFVVQNLDMQRHRVGDAADMRRHDRDGAELAHGACIAQEHAIEQAPANVRQGDGKEGAPAARTKRLKQPSPLPGFALALGYTLFYLCLIVLLPLAVLVAEAAGLGLRGIWQVASEPRVMAALRTSFGLSLAAAVTDCAFGLLIAWVLTTLQLSGPPVAGRRGRSFSGTEIAATIKVSWIAASASGSLNAAK